jgi:hypothetical protein
MRSGPDWRARRISTAVLPLVRAPRATGTPVESADGATERQRLYRQVLELEFDRDTGKVSAEDFEAISGELLARAATHLRASKTAEQAIEEQVEREIAAARRALGQASRQSTSEERAEQEVGR